ncbi:hypothetical protein INT45_000498 [Circinella minor]|uniref:Uncharacterized protein n=1 Tax=Circinella minor TaxID=1195481 RepID=A0A8H7VDI6_9FUNG|nr:hypothetical protein INT45_000498 [Circinella minor]
MSILAPIEIVKYIKELQDIGEDIRFSSFVSDKQTFLVEKSKGLKNYKQFWSHLFGSIAKELKVQVTKGRTNWGTVEAAISGENCLTSSSSSATSALLSDTEKRNVDETYTTKLMYPKWMLSSGKVVEDVMHSFVKECSYEHSAHSLILDIHDPCWNGRFTPDELNELRTYHKPNLQPLPQDLQEYLNKFRGVHDLEDLIAIHMKYRFHPSEADKNWVSNAIGEVLNLYFYNYDIKNKTEADLVRRLWGFIEKCFDESDFYVLSGEKSSTASSNRKNENRSVSGITPLLRKETGTKVDILIKYLDDDFGVGEAGLSGGSTSTKYVSEAGIKLPKTMKDVFWNLLKTSNDSAQKICIPGFIINGTELTVKLIDIPSGNACRLYTLGPMAFPCTAATFYKYFIPLVTIVWQCKSLLKQTLRNLNDDDVLFVPTIENPAPKSTIPPCIHSSKKRKVSTTTTTCTSSS